MEPITTVTSVAAYVDALKEMGAVGLQRPFWFRGHSDQDYRLAPSALRNATLASNEAVMLKRFMQDAQSFLVDAPADRWQWLFLAQHHGVPTRLLDWTENALVALFFACEPTAAPLEGTPRVNGDVWVLLPTRLNVAMNSWSGTHPEDLPMFGVDATLDKYHPLPLVHVPPQELRNPVAALASRHFARIANQWGTFTITDSQTALEHQHNAEDFLRRLSVDGSSKGDILDEMRSLGIEERVIYPDLHRLGRRVREMFTP